MQVAQAEAFGVFMSGYLSGRHHCSRFANLLFMVHSFRHCDTQQPRQGLTTQRFQFDFLNLLFPVQVNGQNVGMGFFTKELRIAILSVRAAFAEAIPIILAVFLI